MPKTIVYHVHGAPRFYDQAAYSIASLLDLLERAGRDDVDVAVWAAHPERVPAHPRVRVFPVSPETLAAWMGPLEFVHRVKMATVCRAVREIGLPLIHVDCDTRWLALPDEPFAALAADPSAHGDRPVAYMHLDEGPFDRGAHPAMVRLLAATPAIQRAHGLELGRRWHMWNAGVIGLPVGAEAWVEETLALADALLPRARSRTFVEQLSFSMMMADRFDLRPFERWLHHYWGENDGVTAALARWFAGLPDGATMSDVLALTRSRGFDDVSAEARTLPVIRRSKLRASLRKRRIDLRALWIRLAGG